MSFGFSIGDIVLISKLAYDLYTSVSIGRKGASRDLKELEDVLFSLRCALNHLGEVAQDVEAQTARGPRGPDLKQNLNHMIASCALTLQELDEVTKKYREVAIDEENDETASSTTGKKKRTFAAMTAKMKVNWKKVRWDQEKQSLQQYREKLRSHTDAINVILSSIIWSNATSAELNNKTLHERTHAMLNQVLNNAQTDASLHQLVQEMHSIFTNPAPQLPPGGLVVMPRYASTASDMASSSNPERGMATSPGFVSFAAPSPMYDAMSRMNISGRPVHHANTAIAAMSVHDLSTLSSRRSPYPPGDNITENAPPIPLNLPSDRNGASSHPSAVLKPAQRDTGPYLLSRSQGHDLFNPQRTLPPSLIAINEQRQAISVREYNTYMQERTQNAERPVPALQPIPVKPAFLRSVAPDLQQLRKGLEYIFRPLSNGGKTDQACAELQERSKEVKEWIVGFSKYIQEITTPNSEQVDLLVALNAEMERTNSKMQRLFYEACNDAQLVNELGKFQRCTKSVRLMKEIEEFEDAMEDWMDEGR